MCSDNDSQSLISDSINRLSDTSSIYHPTSKKGGWQRGDYQALLQSEGMVSCDSSIEAWSEDGHRDHINAKKSKKKDEQKKKRASSIIHGTLVMQRLEQQKEQVLDSTSFLRTPATANSDLLSASFSSPLQKFPSIPVRGNTGYLLSQVNSPITSGSFVPPPPLQRIVPTLKTQSLLDIVNESPVDVASIVASGWAIEPEEYSNEYNTDAASALIDSLLNGVQEGFLNSAVVNSPTRITEVDEEDEEKESQAGWETDDCEITPRLRQVWQEVEPSSAGSRSSFKQSSMMVINNKSKFSESSSENTYSYHSAKGRPQSFIRVPSAIFPHTPSRAKAEKRQSNQSMTSVSSITTKRSRNRYSIDSTSSTRSDSERRSTKRRSIHIVTTNRPMSRKSKYYSRPAQPGFMPSIKQQHLQGARGKFWSPMNSLYIANDEKEPVKEEMVARVSTRYSRRSGQAWVRPRTFEVKDQYRVTIYPPQVEDLHVRKHASSDPDKTPTQAQFRTVQSSIPARPISRASRASSLSSKMPLGPPPTRMLPPVPNVARSTNQSRRQSGRASRGARFSQVTPNSTATFSSCSQCQQSGVSSGSCSCSCSQSYTDGSSSYRQSTHSDSQTETWSDNYTESQSCSCTDASTCSCTMTRSSMMQSQVESVSTPKQSYFSHRERASLDKANGVLGSPHSAPLCPSLEHAAASVHGSQLHLAPYYTSEHPPILDPLPHFSPFQCNFDHFFEQQRRSKRWTRYSTSDASSRCSTCTDGSELAYLRSKEQGSGSTSDGTLNITSSLSYDSDSKSCSSSSPSHSPMSELDSDNGSEQDSDMPLTPTRSEYQSSFGLSESPGYRMSFIVSPMPQSAKRYSQLDELLMFSPQEMEYDDKETEESRMSVLRPLSQFTSTTMTGTTTTTSSGLTVSINGTSRVPRSILKTSSNYRGYNQEAELNHRRPTVSMAVDTIFKSGSSTFSGKTLSTSSWSSSSLMSSTNGLASSAPQRATLATSTVVKHDLEGRIQREENRRKRNESRLYALEKLEGKTKKSSLFFSLLSNASSTATNPASTWNEQEEDLASPLPQTPLTPAKMDLLELQRQVESRQRITQFQNNKAVSFTDVIGFDMGTYPKMPSRNTASITSQEQDALLKLQLKKLSTAIEARQYAKDKCIDK